MMGIMWGDVKVKRNKWLIALMAVLLFGGIAIYLAVEGNQSQVDGGGYTEDRIEGSDDGNSSVDNPTRFSQTIELANTQAEQLMQEYSVPGLAMALVDAENGFTWTHSFGYADTQNSAPVKEDTLFSIASISKPFTAIAVMQLVEEGLIDLDEPLVTYLPEFRMLPTLL